MNLRVLKGATLVAMFLTFIFNPSSAKATCVVPEGTAVNAVVALNNPSLSETNWLVFGFVSVEDTLTPVINTEENLSLSSQNEVVEESITFTRYNGSTTKQKKSKTKSMYSELSDKEFDLLCKVTFAEAGNQGTEGQQAVAGVILARVKSKDFPNSVQEVISQPGQFSTWNGSNVVCYYGVVTDKDGKSVEEAVKKALKDGSGISEKLNGKEPLFFHVTQSGEGTINGKAFVLKDHIFSIDYLN